MKHQLLYIVSFAVMHSFAGQFTPPPKGLMLNLDFQQTREGLIPSKTLYPLHVPQGELGLELFNSRKMLAFQYGQGLSIPHSTLLDPDGSEWIVTIRVFPLTNGLILSQGNDEHGLAIYLSDGAVQAAVRTKNSALTLKESASRGISNYIKRWVTIELRIKDNVAYLSLNRRRVAMVPLDAPLDGENMRIRMGSHNKLPSVLKNKPGAQPDGFTGAISSLKVLRQ